MKRILTAITLMLIGGGVYVMIELLWRGRTHWTMAIVGGICFLICGGMNEVLSWDTPLILQAFLCAIAITAVEFVAGIIINVGLGLAVWDYSDLPLNLLGQICLPFTGVWFVLAHPAIILDDWLRYLLFKQEKPRYKYL